MEVVLQNQDFRSIEIMETNLQIQRNEVCFLLIVILEINIQSISLFAHRR